MVSFSERVKNELLKVNDRYADSKYYELTALLRICGAVSPLNGVKLTIHTEHEGIARRIAALCEELYEAGAEVRVKEGKRLQKRALYTLIIQGESALNILKNTKILSMDDPIQLLPFDGAPMKRKSCRAAFLRGCYLGCGSLSDPNKAYHLEFVPQNDDLAQSICDAANTFDLNARLTLRKGLSVVYIKDAESIAVFLNVVGATEALFAFEDVRVVKDVRNNVNRVVNCEVANIKKSTKAALRQLEHIQTIQKAGRFDFLPQHLRDLAEARLNHPDATLSDLAQLLDVGRSGVNHRFKKIEDIAQELQFRGEG
ncbi:MAG: DNA-binding protein WhiA [Christensenellales bacterium]|jgi:DNA-binding protein WhiA